jgi:hypothetical protein
VAAEVVVARQVQQVVLVVLVLLVWVAVVEALGTVALKRETVVAVVVAATGRKEAVVWRIRPRPRPPGYLVQPRPVVWAVMVRVLVQQVDRLVEAVAVVVGWTAGPIQPGLIPGHIWVRVALVAGQAEVLLPLVVVKVAEVAVSSLSQLGRSPIRVL